MRLWNTLVFGILSIMQNSSFKETQLQNERVKTSYHQKESIIINYFKEKGLTYSGFNLFIRAFKLEQQIEIWISEKHGGRYTLLHTYSFCNSSGVLGPKRKEGDLQIPEGLYEINHFNPLSNFYLSLGINYPNASDRILSDKQHPGGNIYIHGNCITVGCIPITDDKIKELYVLAVEAKSNGQQTMPVHIFPSRLSDDTFVSLSQAEGNKSLIKFWKMLKPIYQDFENTKELHKTSINGKGEYMMQ